MNLGDNSENGNMSFGYACAESRDMLQDTMTIDNYCMSMSPEEGMRNTHEVHKGQTPLSVAWDSVQATSTRMSA
jgi:hypothetical protein